MAPTEATFAEFKHHLLAEYKEWELPHHILRHIQEIQKPVALESLAVLSRDLFFAVHSDLPKILPNDPLFSVESFKNVALHAVAALQHRCVDLYKRNLNSCGFILAAGDDTVVWQEMLSVIQEHIAEEAATRKSA